MSYNFRNQLKSKFLDENLIQLFQIKSKPPEVPINWRSSQFSQYTQPTF